MIRDHIVIRRSEFVAGTQERPEIGVLTQTHATRHPVPWDRIAAGDTVWMKWSGGPIVAQGRVSGFRQIDKCSPNQPKQTTAGFSLFDLAGYWASLPPSFFGMSIYLTDEKWLDHLIQPDARSHGSSWLVLENDDQKDQWLTETVLASPNQIQRNGKTKRSRTIPPSLRFKVFRRDSFTCVYCGSTGLGVKLTVDHKIPFSKGGETNYENLVTACWECNIGKGAKPL